MTVTHAADPVLALGAADLRLLCKLHDREPEEPALSQLAGEEVRHWFGLKLPEDNAGPGFNLLSLALSDYGAHPQRRVAFIENLAADYADLYLTFGKRLSPNESYWLTEDHIERQAPMFDVRGWYAHYHLEAPNWRMRPDDHLVHEMEFVAALLEDGRASALRDAGRFLDQHLLRWSRDFLGGVAQRASTPFYAGLALVTEAALQTIRMVLEEVTGEPRCVLASPSAEQPAMEADTAPEAGLQPSW